MSGISTGDLQDLINRGWTACPPPCNRLLRPGTTSCRGCGRPVTAAGENPLQRRTKSRSRRQPNSLGSLAEHPHHTIELIVRGIPIPQGSVRAPAPGVVKKDNPRLHSWREHITDTALRLLGGLWIPPDCPLQADFIFTLPRPARAPVREPTYPATKPDLDKLIRAAKDALAPASRSRRSRQARPRWKVIADDSRIVAYGEAAKTYPAPLHTHPLALTSPGVVIRLYPARLPAS